MLAAHLTCVVARQRALCVLITILVRSEALIVEQALLSNTLRLLLLCCVLR